MKFPFRQVIALFIFSYFFSQPVSAQDCSQMLFGSVRDNRDGGILPGAVLKILQLNRSIVAEDDGHYHFTNLCPGKYTIQVSFIGYKSREISIDLKKNIETDIRLTAEVQALAGVNITGTRIQNKPLQVSSRLSEKDLELSRGESLGEALKRIPGLNSIQTGPSISKPVIHGLHSNRVLIYNAGVRQEGQQWGSEHAPEIDPFIADQITVVKGAASVMYGADALGGVILVEPAALHYDSGISGHINLVGMSNNGQAALSGTVEGTPFNNNRFSMRVQGTVKEAGNSRAPGYYLKNTGYNEYNGALILGYRTPRFNTELYASTFNSKLGIFEGAHIGSTTDLLAAIQRPRPIVQSGFSYGIGRPYQLINHNILKLRSGYSLEGLGRLNLQYSYQQNNREEYDLVRRSNQDNYQLKFDLTTQALDLYLDHEPIAGISGKIGFNGMFQQNFYDGRYLIPFFDSYSAGAFMIEKWVKDRWELEAGVRYDYKYMEARLRDNPLDNNSPEIRPEFNFNQLSGTFGAGYTIAEGLKLTTTLAKAWRPPAINELFSNGVHHGSARYEIGDRTLGEESSLNLTAGITKQGKKLSGDMNIYYNNINNYIYLKPLLEPVLTIRGAFRAFQYVQVNARFTGADLFADYRFNDLFSASAKYSVVRAYNTATDQHLEFIPADRLSGTLNFSLPDTKKFKRNSLTLTTMHVARQRLVSAEQDVLAPPGAYTLFNADAGTTLRIAGKPMNISLSVQNVLNTRYRDYLNLFRYFADDAGRNVVLRLQVPFGKVNN